MDKLSKDAAEVMSNKVGFRNKNYGQGGYFKILDIIQKEVNEYQNSDIPFTCRKLYNANEIEVLKENFPRNTEDVWGIWLSTYEGIEKCYAYGNDDEITAFAIPNDAVILSDLGEQGILIATLQYPAYLEQGQVIDFA